MLGFLTALHDLIWGAPALVMILGTGMYLSLRTGFVQITRLGEGLTLFRRKLFARERGGVSSFQALCTALAATVGTGNLVGVAGAICIGGPGSIFWMWVCGILGMATKYAEVTLAVRYRVRAGGEYLGGPMYMMEQGLGWKAAAAVYSIFGIAAAFGVGNATQINAAVSAANEVLRGLGIRETGFGNLSMGLILAALIGRLLLGGTGRIGRAAEKLVPALALSYLVLCLGALAIHARALPGAVHSILRGAFTPEAVTGGAVGAAFQTLRVGCARGVFTNEAGMGTASMAHASAEVSRPADQGLMGIVEVFLDTMVICTLTALVVLTSGVDIPYGQERGAELTMAAFSGVYGSWAGGAIAMILGLFALATVLGWGLYGARCAQYLFGPGVARPLALAQTAMVAVGAVLESRTVWLISETVNGLMALPNLLALILLTPELIRLTGRKK